MHAAMSAYAGQRLSVGPDEMEAGLGKLGAVRGGRCLCVEERHETLDIGGIAEGLLQVGGNCLSNIDLGPDRIFAGVAAEVDVEIGTLPVVVGFARDRVIDG